LKRKRVRISISTFDLPAGIPTGDFLNTSRFVSGNLESEVFKYGRNVTIRKLIYVAADTLNKQSRMGDQE